MVGRILNLPRRGKVDREWDVAGRIGSLICDTFPVVTPGTGKSGSFHTIVDGVRYRVTVAEEATVDGR
jgi:hypothetical protein